MTLDQIISLVLGNGGVVALSVAIGFAGYKEGWYFGNQVRKREAAAADAVIKAEGIAAAALAEVKADRDEWKEMALGAIRTGVAIVTNGKGVKA